MTSTFKQPNSTTQSGTAYKNALDNSSNVMKRVGVAFAPHAQTTENMTIRIDAGVIAKVAGIHTEVAGQNSPSLIAPSGNARFDIVFIDRVSGVCGVAAGSEALSPVDPAVPSGKLAIARIRLTAVMNEIANSDITDLRAWPMSTPEAFASGTKMAFFQAAAPTGWTQDTSSSLNDRALRVVNGTGGGTGGTHGVSAPPSTSHNHGHTISAGNHTLTISQIPGHTHSGESVEDGISGNPDLDHGTNYSSQPDITGSTGGGGAHNHSISGYISSNGPTQFRPKYVDMILCTKD